jgi:hypothetical protein
MGQASQQRSRNPGSIHLGDALVRSLIDDRLREAAARRLAGTSRRGRSGGGAARPTPAILARLFSNRAAASAAGAEGATPVVGPPLTTSQGGRRS